MSARRSEKAPDFIREMVAADVAAGKSGGIVATRFPPEPNGFLHIGHSTAICLDFQIAEEHGGTCNLRFDDTNPTTEDERFARAIEEDVRWLGFEWSRPSRYASDYFDRLYRHALQLIRDGGLSLNEVADYLGFNDQSAFQHAFRRWQGVSPGSYRRRLSGSRS